MHSNLLSKQMNSNQRQNGIHRLQDLFNKAMNMLNFTGTCHYLSWGGVRAKCVKKYNFDKFIGPLQSISRIREIIRIIPLITDTLTKSMDW